MFYFFITLLIIIVVAFIFENKFKRIESCILLSNRKDSSGNTLSYQAFVNIEPNWIEILKKANKELKNGEDVINYVNKIEQDKKFKFDQELSLFGKRFSFYEYYDSISNTNIYWSDQLKSFLEDMEITGFVFNGSGSIFFDKFKNTKLAKIINIAPYHIGFLSDLADGYMGDDDFLARFPYRKAIAFFQEIEKQYGSDAMIKTFPKYLQDEFDKYQIKYDPWDYEDYGIGANKKVVKSEWLEDNGIELYEQTMRAQCFRTPYYTIRMKIIFSVVY